MIVVVIMAVHVRDRGAIVQQRICAGFFAQIDHVHPGDVAAGHSVVTAGGLRLGRGARLAAVATAVFVVLRAVIGPLFVQQGFAVGNRDLVVIGVDFGKGQKSMAISAVIHKGRLQRRFHPRDLGKVNVPGELPLVYCFKVKFFDLVSVHHHNAGLFRVGGVYQHFLDHGVPMRPA